MSALNDSAAALYIAMFVALSVWIGIFLYLWRIDAHARALSNLIKHLPAAEEPTDTPQTTLTRRTVGDTEHTAAPTDR